MNKVSKLSFTFCLLGLLLITSCSEKAFDQEDCQELSFKMFKGFPKAAHQFNNHCTKKKIYISKEDCQKALASLMLSGSLKRVKEEYSDKVIGCFNQADIDRFDKK